MESTIATKDLGRIIMATRNLSCSSYTAIQEPSEDSFGGAQQRGSEYELIVSYQGNMGPAQYEVLCVWLRSFNLALALHHRYLLCLAHLYLNTASQLQLIPGIAVRIIDTVYEQRIYRANSSVQSVQQVSVPALHGKVGESQGLAGMEACIQSSSSNRGSPDHPARGNQRPLATKPTALTNLFNLKTHHQLPPLKCRIRRDQHRSHPAIQLAPS